MKDYKEVADEVFKRSDKILADNLRKKNQMVKFGSLAACLCLIVFGAVAWIRTPRLPKQPEVSEPDSIVTDAPSTTAMNDETAIPTFATVPPNEETTPEIPQLFTQVLPETETTTNLATDAPPQTEKTTVSTAKESSPPQTAVKAEAMVLAEPAYPEIPMYPDESAVYDWEVYRQTYEEWNNAVMALRKQPEGYKDGFDSFFMSTSRTFLTDAGTDNKVYSPLSLFMALSMSAEISDGNTRKQILNVLEQDSIEALRSHANSIWQANYMDDGMAKCVLANSLWTNSRYSYKPSSIESLAKNYYSSVYSGEPGSDEYNKLMQDWLNEQTDGLLEDYVSDIEMTPDTILMLASTVNYNGKWRDSFSKNRTKSGIFHSPTGDIECDFMNAEWEMTYYWGDKFASVSLRLENNGEMRLILPDEGFAPEELINDDEVIAYMMNAYGYGYANQKYLIVNMSIPKFDVSSNIDLIDGLKKLGITDAFSSSDSDFSPLTKMDGLYISKAEQDTRVMIDEEGCKAASLTVMALDGKGMPPDERVDFILDRPFIFEIMSETGLPLFIGIVNNPIQ